MMGRTHLAFAFLLGIVFENVVSVGNEVLFLAIVMVAALIPDVDNADSKLGRYVKLISKIFEHRGYFHSVFLILLGLFFFNAFWFIAFALGVVSHLILDSMTLQGITPLYPLKMRISGFIRTGSFMENIFFVLIVVVGLYVMVKGF